MGCDWIMKVDRKDFCKKESKYIDSFDCKLCREKTEIEKIEGEDLLRIFKGDNKNGFLIDYRR